MRWTTLQFTLRPLKEFHFPLYKGFTLRGGFGQGLKKITCTNKIRDCSQCSIKNKCLYIYIFETPSIDDYNGLFLSGNNYFPHPFVIQPPLEEKTSYSSSEVLQFNLVLIGRAIDYFPYFIFSFEELGKIGIGKGRQKYELVRVSSLKDSNGEVIYSSGRGILSSNILISTFKEIKEKVSTWKGKDRLKVRLLTPLRIKHGGRLINNLPFDFLIQSILIRSKALSYHLEENEELEIDFNEIMAQAKNGIEIIDSKFFWKNLRRYSQRKNLFMNLGGLLGEISYQGELYKFLPFLLLGQELHLGKATSFGFGMIQLELF